MSLSRRAVLALFLPATAHAQAAGPVSPIAAPIAALNAALRAGMVAGRVTPFAERAAKLRPAVERAFDLPAILAASVGPRFAPLPDPVKAELLEAFSAFTVATWAGNFDSDGGETFEISPEIRPSGADRVVSTRILPRAGEATRLDYVMRQGPAGWRAVDILLNGTISRVAVQRSDFRTLISGGDAGPLLATLRRRAAELAR
jgi:phospholipid transport system substrate-binding protein